MNKRELLRTLINSFGEDYLIAFLSSAIQSFRPDQDDYSRTLNQTEKAVSSLKKIGEAEFDDGSRLISILGNLAQPLTSRSGKKRQYEIARKILKEENYDAGFFIFHDGSGKFRFSLIASFYSGTRREFSNFRRYTYFVSPELPNKTFINQLGKGDFTSLEKILAVFSLESVSNDFYNEFEPKFKRIANAVQNTDDTDLREDFALLFVIRTIFLGFVQKKGWLGGKEKFLEEFWEEYNSTNYGKDKFYENWLEPLFFEALNSPPGRKVKYQNNDFSPETERILQDAPFLNGELFKHKHGVDNKGLRIPDGVIKEFLEFLFQYNFTIEENTLYDEELELNPEFLGIIFERLVNKADGAVYTPRTEVDFMCRMALVQWLIKNSSADMLDLYHLMFREGGTGSEHDDDQKSGDFSPNQIRELSGLLRNVTVCDPAAGSGAFEVGMLHVLEEVIDSLAHRKNTPEDVAKLSPFEQKKEIIANSLYGVEVKQWAVWINQLRLWLSLFVDMPDEYKDYSEPLLPSLNFKIRCGDSLVQRIGSKLFPVQGHANLPSTLKLKITELKIMKVDFFNNKGKNEDFIKQQENLVFREIIDEEIEEKRKELRILTAPRMTQENFTFARTGADKQLELKLLEQKIEKLKTEIEGLEEQRANLKDDHPLIWSIEFAEVFYERGGFDIIIGNPPYVRQEEIKDPYGALEPKEYKAKLHDMVRMDFPEHFRSAKQKIDGKSDLYTYFYIRSLRLLNSNGIHVFICSNSWLDVGYGVWMQSFLLNNVPMKYIIDNHAKRSFASSDVNTIISIFEAPDKKSALESTVKFVAFKKPFEEVLITENLLYVQLATTTIKNDDFRAFPKKQRDLLEDGTEYEDEESRKLGKGNYIGEKWGGIYLRAPDIFFTILEKGKGKLLRLKEIADVKRGITTGCNEFFYLTEQQAKEWGIEEEFLIHAIMKTDEVKSIDLKQYNTNGYFLWCRSNKKDLKGKNILRYIEWGEKQKIKIKQGKKKGELITGYQNIETVKNRKIWFSIADRTPAPLLWIIAHNERSICFLNRGLISSDNFFEIRTSKFNHLYLALYLSSTLGCLIREIYGRSNFGGGLLKTQKPDLQKFPILSENHLKFMHNSVSNFISRANHSIFIECGLNPNSDVPISEQIPEPISDRKNIDNEIFDALNLTHEEQIEVYRAVCQLVWNRISKAKSM